MDREIQVLSRGRLNVKWGKPGEDRRTEVEGREEGRDFVYVW